jgi:hypothetical protein
MGSIVAYPSESHDRGGGNDAVKSNGIGRFRLQGGRPAEGLGSSIRSQVGADLFALSLAQEDCRTHY